MPLIHKRIGFLFVVFAAFIALAGLKATWIGAVRAKSLTAAATTQQVEEITVPARRGAITDRSGVQLAVSEPAADIAATPYLIKDPVAASKKIAPLLGLTEDEVLRKLSQKDTGFVYLDREVPADRAGRVDRLEMEGLQIIPRTRRSYPRSWLASQVLGDVGVDG